MAAHFTADEIGRAVDHAALASAIGAAFAGDAVAPQRQRLPIGTEDSPGDFLVMPGWMPGRYAGAKLVTVFPGNASIGKPSIDAHYALFAGEDGRLLATFDGAALTEARTAGVSLLGQQLMAPRARRCMVLLGAGALAHGLATAHAHGSPGLPIAIWNRTPEKAERLASRLRAQGIDAEPARDLEAAVRRADLVCCAAASDNPLLRGAWIADGAHVSLLGAYRPNMREIDADGIGNASIAVDIPAALTDSGDLAAAIAADSLNRDGAPCLREALGGLAARPGRFTLFKSIGSAIADLAAGVWLWERARPSQAGRT